MSSECRLLGSDTTVHVANDSSISISGHLGSDSFRNTFPSSSTHVSHNPPTIWIDSSHHIDISPSLPSTEMHLITMLMS